VAATVFSALGDANRLRLIQSLSDGGTRSISQLSEDMELTRQGVTKHLRVLEGAGLVKSSRVGRESRFRFEPQAIDNARSYLDSVSQQWDMALARLKAFVEI
jgi:DNA-binding transcriptional ArsR family regulator